MSGFKEVTGTINVPSNTGVAGFLRAIETLLRKPRLQNIEIDARGQVRFRRFVQEGEAETNGNNFGVDFSDIEPYAVVRNASVQELLVDVDVPAPVVIGFLFERAARDNMAPSAFVVGQQTSLWQWYAKTTGYLPQERKTLFGLPVLADRQVPDTTLLLSAGYGKEASFLDTQVSYKVEMPAVRAALPEVRS